MDDEKVFVFDGKVVSYLEYCRLCRERLWANMTAKGQGK